MDEPLSNLDAKLRVHMRTELAELHQRLGATFIYVTHDQVEAMTMSNRVAMMDSGDIIQLGTPIELYARPANVKVAQFIGSPAINLLPGTVGAGGGVELLGRQLALEIDASGGRRPHHRHPPRGDRGAHPRRRLRTERPAARASAPARKPRSEHILHFDLPGADLTPVIGRAPAQLHLPADGQVALTFDTMACHLFDASGARVAARGANAGEAGEREPVVAPFRS